MSLSMVLVVACGSRLPEGVPAESVAIEASELFHFDALEEMKRASDIVVLGTVDQIIPFKLEEASGDQPGLQLLSISLIVDEAIVGEPAADVTFGWNGWDVAADGTVGPRRVFNGVDLPLPGERYVLFLFELSPEERSTVDYPRYGLISFDGILRIKGNDVSTTLAGARLAHDLARLSLTDLVNQTRAAFPSAG
jgi:hypothetical protein